MNVFKNILTVIFLPFVLVVDTVKSSRSVMKKICYIAATVIIFGLVWLNMVSSVISFIKAITYDTGVVDKITKVPVRGTSMLPTIQDGSEIELKSHLKYGLSRGDIVSFTNEETRGLHYLKRIVGLPGESISIKNGTVFINGKALQEDYTLNQLPTYGNTALIDCGEYTIPEGQYMVLGDNRTVSSDSRVLGFISEDDINGVIKTGLVDNFVDEQKQLKITKVNIKSDVFLKKINEVRVKNNHSNLVTHATLNQLAQKRTEQIKDKFEDWKNDSVPADKMLEDNGYRFNKVHEFVTFGYLDEQSIVDQILDSIAESDEFLSDQYTEVGIGVTEKVNNACVFPVISVILSWPAVPTYDKAVLDSWQREISINNTSLSNLQTWVGQHGIDQAKLKNLINVIAEMQQIATRIYNKEKNREWLTQKDYQDIRYYDEQIKVVEKLDQELFGQEKNVQGVSSDTKEPRRY